MQINYKVTLTNPIKDFLKVQDSYRTEGSFSVLRNSRGLLISGAYLDGDVKTKAYDYSFVGEDYLLTEVDALSLDMDTYSLTDISDIFSILGGSIHDPSFLKLQKNFKLVKRSPNNVFKIDVYLEKSTDIYAIKIDKDGVVTKLNGQVKPYSNVLEVNEVLDNSYTLGYYLVSKPLKVETNDHLYIPNEDLLKIPTGFCTITNKILTKNAMKFSLENTNPTITSAVNDMLTFSSPLLVDGVLSSSYKIKEYEKIIFGIPQEYVPVSITSTHENIKLIYEVLPDGTFEPYIAVATTDTTALELSGYEFNGDVSLYTTLLNADPEFLKRYVMKEYVVKITTSTDDYTIINQSLMNPTIRDIDFKGKFVKYEQ